MLGGGHTHSFESVMQFRKETVPVPNPRGFLPIQEHNTNPKAVSKPKMGDGVAVTMNGTVIYSSFVSVDIDTYCENMTSCFLSETQVVEDRHDAQAVVIAFRSNESPSPSASKPFQCGVPGYSTDVGSVVVNCDDGMDTFALNFPDNDFSLVKSKYTTGSVLVVNDEQTNAQLINYVWGYTSVSDANSIEGVGSFVSMGFQDVVNYTPAGTFYDLFTAAEIISPSVAADVERGWILTGCRALSLLSDGDKDFETDCPIAQVAAGVKSMKAAQLPVFNDGTQSYHMLCITVWEGADVAFVLGWAPNGDNHRFALYAVDTSPANYDGNTGKFGSESIMWHLELSFTLDNFDPENAACPALDSVDGVIYWMLYGSRHALDAETGVQIWGQVDDAEEGVPFSPVLVSNNTQLLLTRSGSVSLYDNFNGTLLWKNDLKHGLTATSTAVPVGDHSYVVPVRAGDGREGVQFYAVEYKKDDDWPWFWIIVAAGALVFVIIVAVIACCVCKNRRSADYDTLE